MVKLTAVAAAIGLVLRLVQMSGWLIHLVRGIFENIGSVQESMETIAKPHDLRDAPDARPLVVDKGAISFDKIRFNYGRTQGLFEGLDLQIKPGERIAVQLLGAQRAQGYLFGRPMPARELEASWLRRAA